MAYGLFWISGAIRSKRFKPGLKECCFLLLPFIYILIRFTYFPEANIQVDWSKLGRLTKDILYVTAINFRYFLSIVHLDLIGNPILLLGPVLGILLFRMARKFPGGESILHPFPLIFIAVILYLVSVIPYLMVGSIPAPQDWISRFQTHMAFGIALGFIGFTRLLPEVMQRAAIACFVAFCVNENILSRLEYANDWFKFQAVSRLMATHPVVINNSTFIVDDQSGIPNARHRNWRHFELNHSVSMISGKQDKFFIILENEDDWEKIFPVNDAYWEDVFPKEYYRDLRAAKSYTPASPTHTLRIILKPEQREVMEYLGSRNPSALWNYWFHRQDFERQLDNSLEIVALPLDG